MRLMSSKYGTTKRTLPIPLWKSQLNIPENPLVWVDTQRGEIQSDAIGSELNAVGVKKEASPLAA